MSPDGVWPACRKKAPSRTTPSILLSVDQPWLVGAGHSPARLSTSEANLELRLSLPLRVVLVVDDLPEIRICQKQGIGAAEDHPVEQVEIREAQLRPNPF